MTTLAIVLPLLFPDLPGLSFICANFAVCALGLISGRRPVMDDARSYEHLAISAWLAASPWLLRFQESTIVTWLTIACAVVLFLPAAFAIASNEKAHANQERHSQWRRPF